MFKWFAILSVCFVIFSCDDTVFSPKPHAYPRLYLPQKQYLTFDTTAPFSFVYPSYAQIVPYEKTETDWHPHWYNIHYLPFNATLHLSYLKFNNRDEFNNLYDDTRKLVYKHDIRAEEIEETELFKPQSNISGVIYELKGNTATNLNFYISDGKQHFLRGALYFNTKTEIDSIAPVVDFLKQDIVKMIESAKWKDSNLQ